MTHFNAHGRLDSGSGVGYSWRAHPVDYESCPYHVQFLEHGTLGRDTEVICNLSRRWNDRCYHKNYKFDVIANEIFYLSGGEFIGDAEL